MTVYINTQTLAYPVYQSAIEQEYPNTSFPTPFQPPEPYKPVLETPQPPYNQITQAVQQTTPVKTEGQWYQEWTVVDLDPEQIEYNENQAKQQNKQQAEQLLQQTDWTATVDISDPVYSDPYLGNQAAFLAYRSQVRKIAVNPPVTVSEWPIKPDEVWVSV
jgi:hypothetical protein